MEAKGKLEPLLRKIWLGTEAFLFAFYLAVGVYFCITSGVWRVLVLFNIAGIYEYPALSGSLVMFGAYGLVLLKVFRGKAVPMLFFTYAAFEGFAQFPPRDFIIVAIVFIGAIGAVVAYPSLRLGWGGLVFVCFPLWLAWAGAWYFGSDEYLYELMVMGAFLLMFKPRDQV